MRVLLSGFLAGLSKIFLSRRIGALALVGVLTLGALAVSTTDAEARRMGGSRSFGRQSQMIQRQPVAPAQQAAPRTQPTPANTAATPPRNRWLGPLAGIAAGLGIAALLSHFGLGGAFAALMANVIMIALVVFAVIFVFRLIARRRTANLPEYARGGGPAFTGAAASGTSWAPEPRFNGPSGVPAEPLGGSGSALPGGAAGQLHGVPADFDTAAFVRNAKVYFVRMQASWDAGNLDDIRHFTTPEMFAEIKIDFDERGTAANQTDVVQLDADLLGVEEHPGEALASVRFHGLMREAAGAAAEPFTEIWNLTKATQGGDGWLLAGIQQVN